MVIFIVVFHLIFIYLIIYLPLDPRVNCELYFGSLVYRGKNSADFIDLF